MPHPKYKAVIFDWDDTLVESRVAKWDHHKATAKKFYNMDLTDEMIREHWGKPFPVLVSDLYKNADTVEKITEAINSIRHEFNKKVYPGSLGVVNTLLEHGIKVGLVSAANPVYLIEDLKQFEFPVERFTLIHGPEDSPVHKPDPGVFIPVFEKLAKEGITDKKDIVYVGDWINDLEAAKGAGIDFIAVTTGLYTEEDFKEKGATVIVKSIEEVLEKVFVI